MRVTKTGDDMRAFKAGVTPFHPYLVTRISSPIPHHLHLVTFIRILAVLPVIAALPMQGFAQDYPARTVRMIVPQTPGGATDVFTRAVGQRLAERWARSVIIENRGGAAGTLGTEIAAKAPQMAIRCWPLTPVRRRSTRAFIRNYHSIQSGIFRPWRRSRSRRSC